MVWNGKTNNEGKVVYIIAHNCDYLVWRDEMTGKPF